VYLVDTSVWIDFFKANANPAVERLKGLLTTGVDIGISTAILQEILQGTADRQQFAKYRTYFETIPLPTSQRRLRTPGLDTGRHSW